MPMARRQLRRVMPNISSMLADAFVLLEVALLVGRRVAQESARHQMSTMALAERRTPQRCRLHRRRISR